MLGAFSMSVAAPAPVPETDCITRAACLDKAAATHGREVG